MTTVLNEKIEQIIVPTLEHLGYELVYLQISGKNHKLLQIMIEKKDLKPITIADCQKASNAISAILDVEDIITESYNLEISSPGLDRPLTKLSDYNRFKDYDAKIETKIPIDEQKRFKGIIKGETDGIIEILHQKEPNKYETVKIDFNNIEKAKLIITDDLIKKDLTKTIN